MDENRTEVRAISQLRLSKVMKEQLEPLTTEDIRRTVIRTAEFVGADDVDIEAIVSDLESIFATVIGRHSVITSDDGWEPWLDARAPNIEWRFWDRYRQHLLRDHGWASTTIDKMDESTEGALGLLHDPIKRGSWSRRGLIVGDVQSGKTSNYIGLICKAADAGYKVIVVLAGFHKSLRCQTQIRLEEGFLGYDRTYGDSENAVGPVGVGLIDPSLRADSITTRADDGDFKRQVANNFGGINPGGNPLVFVVKKNASVLRNLNRWVRSVAGGKGGVHRVHDIPLLVIDDEADQGSVDTGKQDYDGDGNPDPDHDPTAINRLIRRLLKLFDQHAYVGYTATPFANVFIHDQAATTSEGEDLFPKSFILSLPTPSNHVGPSTVFGYTNDDGSVVEGLPVIRPVEDHAATLELSERFGWMPPKHDKHHVPMHGDADKMPPSLEGAVHSFLLSTAARYARGQDKKHNTMLVHVTRFTAVQARVATQLRDKVTSLKRRIRYGEGELENNTLDQLEKLWNNDFAPTTAALVDQGFVPASLRLSWSDVEPHIGAVASSIRVREINGLAGEVLDYKRHEDIGLNVIAVGGDKLSRGLTLEGLTTSYFLRASRMYDTLMQMGRWFGYRPGYLDLCRLYTTGEMEEWFSHIAMASDELREDFGRMVASGGTPRDFGHRVRSHPTMLVTSAVKMRSGHEIDVTFSGDISETVNFRRDRSTLQNNLAAAEALLNVAWDQHGAPATVSDKSSGLIWSATQGAPVKGEHMIAFLRQYSEHPVSKRVKTKLLADYIEAEMAEGRLTDWSILVGSGEAAPKDLGPLKGVSLVQRAWHLTSTADRESLQEQNHYRIRRLLSPTDEFADLTPSERDMALRLSIEAWEENPYSRSRPGERRARPARPAGAPIREVRPESRGLLMIYPLDPGDESEGKVEVDALHLPVIGFGISFPTVGEDRASRVRYTVSNMYYLEEVLGDSE